MSTPTSPYRRFVTGPDGAPLSPHDLPPSDLKRWVVGSKATVVCAVRGGMLTLEEACIRYSMSVDEFLRWQEMAAKYGLLGLRATHVQKYRQAVAGPAIADKTFGNDMRAKG